MSDFLHSCLFSSCHGADLLYLYVRMNVDFTVLLHQASSDLTRLGLERLKRTQSFFLMDLDSLGGRLVLKKTQVHLHLHGAFIRVHLKSSFSIGPDQNAHERTLTPTIQEVMKKM